MALVAYDNSDSSEFEDEEETINVPILPETQQSSDTQTDRADPANSIESVIFKSLPQPIKNKMTIEENDEFLQKKEPVMKTKAKITVPSLNDFKDVEDTIPNIPKLASSKKSGLLSMLPQPKNTVTASVMSKTLIPHVLTQKSSITTNKKKHNQVQTSDVTKLKTSSKDLLSIDYSDDEDDEDVQNDFFSIHKSIDTVEPEIPIENTDEVQIMNVATPGAQRASQNVNAYFKETVVGNDVQIPQGASLIHQSQEDDQYIHVAESSKSTGEMELDEEAIRMLCGARGMKRKEEIQIVDIKQQEVLDEARQIYMKGLLEDTSKRTSSSKRKGNEPTNQQKRKHQITYLAHQAKANEIELQNQWANSRVSRRQTQSKYGF